MAHFCQVIAQAQQAYRMPLVAGYGDTLGCDGGTPTRQLQVCRSKWKPRLLASACADACCCRCSHVLALLLLLQPLPLPLPLPLLLPLLPLPLLL